MSRVYRQLIKLLDMVFPCGYNGGKMKTGAHFARTEIPLALTLSSKGRGDERTAKLSAVGKPMADETEAKLPAPLRRGRQNRAYQARLQRRSAVAKGFCMKHAILPNEPTDFGLENSIYRSVMQWVTR